MNQQLKEAQAVARSRNGKLISKYIITNHDKLEWHCLKCDNKWLATWSNVKGGSWCMRCSGYQKKTMDDLHLIAKERGGKCLSVSMPSIKTKLKWECGKCNHIWEASYDSIRKGSWCLACSKHRKLSLKDAQLLANNKNGKLLSKEYFSKSVPLRWQCGECKFEWTNTFTEVESGYWCPKCTNRRMRYFKEDMQFLAKQNNGEFLSKEFTNLEAKYKWKCKRGHIWSTTGLNVRDGKWCPDCAK